MKDELVTKSYLEERLDQRLIEQDTRWFGYIERRFSEMEARLTKQLKDGINEISNLVNGISGRLDDNDAEHAIMQRDIGELQRQAGIKR